MSNETFNRDQNRVAVDGGVGDTSGEILKLRLNDTTKRLLTEPGGLVPEDFDYMSFSYTGSDLTGVVYKTGGSGGTTVATLTLAYTGSNLTEVTRT